MSSLNSGNLPAPLFSPVISCTERLGSPKGRRQCASRTADRLRAARDARAFALAAASVFAAPGSWCLVPSEGRPPAGLGSPLRAAVALARERSRDRIADSSSSTAWPAVGAHRLAAVAGRVGDRPVIRRAGGRKRFCCSLGAERDPATVRDIQAYLMMSCRCRAFVEIGREGIAVHFEQPGEAYLFAEVWTEWATAGTAPAENPSERLLPRPECPPKKDDPDHAPAIQNRAEIPPQWGDT